jgi:hypothetical protein
VDRALDELLEPFRTFNFKEQEIVLMKAIVTLNSCMEIKIIKNLLDNILDLPSLSTEAAEQVADFRDRIQVNFYIFF